MVKIETSKIVNASQDKIFSLITDFERLPTKFPGRYRSLRVIEKTDNSVAVEEDVTVAGRELHQITRHTMVPKHYLRSEVVDGDAKGTVVEIRLEPEGTNSSENKTKVSINADLKLGKLGTVLGVFAKGKIKGGLEHMIEEFENVVKKNEV